VKSVNDFFKTHTNLSISPVDLCEADVDGIRNWKFNLTVEVESELTESGKLEHHELGQRFKKRLPTVLGGEYIKDDFEVKSYLIC